MTLMNLLRELGRAGISLELAGDGLRVHAPAGALSQELRAQLGTYKCALMQWLRGNVRETPDSDELPRCQPDPTQRHLPFPLSDLQLGFYMADDPYMEFHVRPHYYMERDVPELDIAGYEAAWNKALRRHRGELVTVTGEGQLVTVRDPAPLTISQIDLRDLSGAGLENALLQIRAEMMRTELPLDCWPWLDVRVSFWMRDGIRQCRIHYNHNNFFSDGFGTTRLLREIERYYKEPALTLPALTLGFRDAALALEHLAESPAGQAARRYWEDRLPALPDAPALPVAIQLDRRCRSRLKRRECHIDEVTWSAFKDQARNAGVTPSNALFTVYAEIISAWSNSRHFVLSNMMTRRLGIHPEIQEIIGNFASLYPLEVDFRPLDRFADRAWRLQKQVLRDSEYLQWGGMQVMQALNRKKGDFGNAAIPFVIGSGLFMAGFEKPDYSCLETSQVMLDHQFWELEDGRLFYVWDLLEEFFMPGVVDAMWEAYAGLIARLAHQPPLWNAEVLDVLPAAQERMRTETAPPQTDPPAYRLENYLDTAASLQPFADAVSCGGDSISYVALASASEAIAGQLRAHGVGGGTTVAVVANRGIQLAQAVFGILKSGGAYVPVDPALPEERRAYILRDCAVAVVLTEAKYVQKLRWPEAVRVIDIGEASVLDPSIRHIRRSEHDTELAYVIYTSGSTGKPKGVMIEHRGAVNTIEDVNQRFEVGVQDSLFGISSFGFDLSVYDLFGSIAAGVRLVYPAPGQTLNPAHWVDLMERERITLWNSAPPLAVLLAEAAEARQTILPDLRLVLLSGDWIPLELPARIRRLAPNARIVSLGGATEASIWSILYEIGDPLPGWSSIPYGYPMRNQSWHVLDAWGRPAPDWATGELYIGGVGLARGYWGDVAKSGAAFGCHSPHAALQHQRLYRTGDMGRYRPGGILEFLGRRDTQVKIQGHRIELGEIECELSCCAGVQTAAVVVRRDAQAASPRLIAHVVPMPGVELQIDSLRQQLAGRLPSYMVPHAIGVLPQLPLSANGKVDRAALPDIRDSEASRPAARDEPRNSTEAKLRDIWRIVLGRETVDITEDFFDMGGQSFEAVRIVGAIRQEMGITISIGMIWEARSIERLAERLEQSSARQAGRCHVTLRHADAGTPLYLAHPAGGSALCYSRLAGLLNRPVAGFQAAGFVENEQPLSSIEEIAGRYVQEIQEMQPDGPLFVGGWSSGALIAFEMASQLQRQGRKIAGMIAIDCPAPLTCLADVDETTLLAWFVEDLSLEIPLAALPPVSAIATLNEADQLQYVARSLMEIRHPAADAIQDLVSVFKVFKEIVRSSRRYVPSPLEVDLLLLRALDGQVSEFASHPKTMMPHWGWSELAQGQVDAHYHAGSHHTLLLPPQLDDVAKAMSFWLNRHDPPACGSHAGANDFESHQEQRDA
ncbi:amino acid adenylation domain-containing protein [Herbaspirillum sp. HC18]|nr:amino acid adenylation domain-containing protein [Herbaspirillum sp. HC18]